MPAALKPANERERLAELTRLGLLDSAPDECFEAVTRCAQRMGEAPIALISLIDDDRQWFMCKIGLDVSETPRAVSFCAHAIHSSKPLIVPDARMDARFRDNPLVTGPPNILSYLGVPLVTSEGLLALGTLCIVDFEPRDWTERQINAVADLAKVTMKLVELLDLNRDLSEMTTAAQRASA